MAITITITTSRITKISIILTNLTKIWAIKDTTTISMETIITIIVKGSLIIIETTRITITKIGKIDRINSNFMDFKTIKTISLTSINWIN